MGTRSRDNGARLEQRDVVIGFSNEGNDDDACWCLRLPNMYRCKEMLKVLL